MNNVIKGGKIIRDDDCGCGKPLKVTDPKRKIIKKVIKKRI